MRVSRHPDAVHDGPVVDASDFRDDVKAAYEQGRRDERKTRRRAGHPIIATFVVLLALVGGVLVFLAVREGSFSEAGVVADQNLAQAASDARPAMENAAARTGEALRDVGNEAREQPPQPAVPPPEAPSAR